MSLVSERRTVVSRRRRARGFEHNQLGVTFYRSGALDLAIEQFELATRRAPWVFILLAQSRHRLAQQGRLGEG
jgi:hypothetical protein